VNRKPIGRCIEFGTFKLYPELGQLHKFGMRLKEAHPQHVAFLTILVERLGERVTKDEIKSMLWPNQHLAKNRLNVLASELWSLLGDTDREQRKYFVSLGHQGYCFVHPVRLVMNSGSTLRQLEAEDACRMGRRCLENRRESSLREGIYWFKKAVDLSPSNPMAWVGLAEAKVLFGMHCGEAPAEAFEGARTAAQEALRIDASTTEAFVSLGWVQLCLDRDWIGAASSFRHAIRSKYHYPWLHNGLALLNIATGYISEAVACVEQARKLNPLSAPLDAVLCQTLYFARRYEDAIDAGRRSLASNPDSCMAHSCLAQSLIQVGEMDEAMEHLLQAKALSANSKVYTGLWAEACARAGFVEQAEQGLQELLSLPRHDYKPSYLIGLIHLGLGKIEDGLFWLEKSCAERSHWVLFVGADPKFDSLQANPSFQKLLANVGVGSPSPAN
jgi:DNA-binding winged helix-turn-helix (wHTH) protein/Flp pilus assembly protein TadD